MHKLLALLAGLSLSACASLDISDYEGVEPTFDPNEFFNNQIIAEGFVRNRSGKVSRWFTADIKATWDDNGGVLDEVFQWSDGEEQVRVWEFEKRNDSTYTGTAGDVIGEADMEIAGNAIRMRYQLDVPLSNGNTIAINMDDWLYQVSDKTIVNVTTMRKFGFRVGDVVLTMRVVD